MANPSSFDPRALPGWLADIWSRVMDRPAGDGQDTEADAAVVAAAVAEAPLIWLIGKVQSGKSSIVQAITGASEAEVGSGFRVCTTTARVFDFPAEAPLLRFLDTRGLGEVGYDPAEDLVMAEAKARLILVVVRAMDHQQHAVIDAVSAVRKRRPGWPIVVAQTCLHDGYDAGQGHILPYPYADPQGASADPEGFDGRIPERLSRSLAHQREMFRSVPGHGPMRFAPIDLTRPDDGLAPQHYGLDALIAAISDAAPASLGSMLHEIRTTGRTEADRRMRPMILGHAAVAAAADAVPLAGIVAVPGVQGRLLYALAAKRGVAWDRQSFTEFGACLGASVLTRIAAQFGIRQLVKLVPVYGQTVGAAAAAATSFATTYALGMAALEFLARRERNDPDAGAVAQAFKDNLSTAFKLARERGFGAVPTGSDDAKR